MCEKGIIKLEPLTLIQNIQQNIDSNGELINFQKSNKTNFSRLLTDGRSIKIRKNGTYILNVSGTLQWTNPSGLILSFALLKNGVPVSDTIQTVTVPTGTNTFNKSVSRSFTFKRGDILTFEAESSVLATTFVPSIRNNGVTFYGNGFTLRLESLNGISASITNFNFNYKLGVSYVNNIPNGIYMGRTFFFIENLDYIVNIINTNVINGGTYAISYIGQNIGGVVYIVQIIAQANGITFNPVICQQPYVTRDQFFKDNL
jgi:hypothetical protein